MTDRTLLVLDHDAHTVSFDADVVIDPTAAEQWNELLASEGADLRHAAGFRVSAPWYDGAFTTSEHSVMDCGGVAFNINDVLATHCKAIADGDHDGATYDVTEFPPHDDET